MSQEQAIALYQPMLHSVACRILGSMSDAEDIVQDTFLKWLTIDTSKVRNTKSYLIRSVTNNCLNHLQALEKHKNEWMDAIPQFLHEQWDRRMDFDKEIQEAIHLIHVKLEPVERAVFVMREVFNMEYEEIQEVIKRKKENCRQLLHRARKKMQSEDTNPENAMPARPGFLQIFKNACQKGQMNELIQHLKGDLK